MNLNPLAQPVHENEDEMSDMEIMVTDLNIMIGRMVATFAIVVVIVLISYGLFHLVDIMIH